MTVIYQVDAFAKQPFSGNPAAVCLLQQAADKAWMQAVASEMNLSETAFVYPANDGFSLRWFTPVQEVDLCGHATLATAHALWAEKWSDTSINFDTRSGKLIARYDQEAITLDFPLNTLQKVTEPTGLYAALGIQKKPDDLYFDGQDYLLALQNASALKALRPDFTRLAQIQTRGITVTAPSSSPDYDFICRFFAPAVGINEDPATGSALCSLTPYWAQRLGKQTLRAFQASARGGYFTTRLTANRVQISGQAITIFKGTLHV